MNYVPNQNEKILEEKHWQVLMLFFIEIMSTLYQNDPPFFASSSKISPHSSVTLSLAIESIAIGSLG